VGSVGVVLGEPLTNAFDDPQAARFLAGVAGVCAAERSGLTLVPITGADDDADRVAEAVVDGFVVWTTADDDPVVGAVAATGRPAAVHGGPGHGLPVVTIDNRAAARAIGALAFAGARRPAVLGFPLDRRRASGILVDPDPAAATFPITRERLAGYREATDRPLTVAVAERNSAAEGARLAAALLDAPEPPDAIAAMSDELALGARQAAPGVPITGWDGSDAAVRAGIPTVWQSLHGQGAECARIALGRPPSGDPPEWRVIE
jgi:DNA-binding LacI/PurR family transcriptional regulator